VERDELPSVPRHPPSVPRHPSSAISYTTFDGIELTARKRFSQKWMMAANYSYNTGKQSAPVPTRDYLDPTNHDTTEGKATSVTPWTAKISALYSLPWQMSISGLADISDVFPARYPVRQGDSVRWQPVTDTCRDGVQRVQFEHDAGDRHEAKHLDGEQHHHDSRAAGRAGRGEGYLLKFEKVEGPERVEGAILRPFLSYYPVQWR
jgi:TonB dependent receptor